MIKFKESFKNVFNNVKKIFEKFPATMIVIAFATLVGAFFFDTDVMSNKVLEKIIIFCFFYVFGLFFTESYFKNKPKLSILLYIIFAVISAWFTHLSIESTSNLLSIWTKTMICYCIIFPILSIWKLYKMSERSVGEYLTKFFSNFIKASFIYGILAGGIAAVTAIFIYLILDDRINYDLIWRMELILLGLFYIPNCIECLINLEEDVSKFCRVVVKYVLGGLLVTAFIIIYMYMIKIIVLRKIPANQIFRILATLFACGLPIWTMNSLWEKENNVWQKIINKLPFAFIPFILLQIYSIVARISANGLTEARYLCVMLVIFEIIYSVLFIRKKEKIADMLLIFNVLTVISIIIPFVNMFNMSELSQYNRLKLYTEKEEFSEKEQSQILGAYRYLKNSENGEKYIERTLNNEDIEKILAFNPSTSKDYYYDYMDYEYIYASLDNVKNINIKDYSSFDLFSKADYGYGDKLADDNNVKIENLDEILNGYIQKYEENEENFRNEEFEKNNEIIVDENTKIVLNYLDIDYNKRTKEIRSYRIGGYVFYK